ncbi:NUMOD3 domain-containing DNA-binding protein [Ochrobactrum sp. MYb379]|uniref:NUMOD3 domain-containing DNA-binding protein n=1 Tax=Ochrobactrum sp. MYb379 TaxID=2745275 RepID=UPI0030B2EB6F
MEYYTYLWRDAGGVPFYVGKGKGKRAWHTYKRSVAFKEVYARGGCAVEIVDWFIHEAEAHAYEMVLIERYGRRDIGSGTLVNLTDGGDGSSGLSKVVRAKIGAANRGNKYALGLVRSVETRARISKSKLGQKTRLGASLSEDTRKKISESLRGRPLTEDHRIKLSAISRGKPKPAAHIVNVSDALHLCPPRNDSTSGLKGVSANRTTWVARITVNGVRQTIGYYAKIEDAARAYDAAAIGAWGMGNCYLNFPAELAA